MLLKTRTKKRRCQRIKLLLLLSPILIVLLWLGFKEIQSYFTQPDAIFILGGESDRELFAAKFAQEHPDLPIWLSSGGSQWFTEKIFAKAGINRERLHLDYRAVDTVTNFTTLVDDFQAQNIKSVYLITSSSHMTRARIIGEIVFGTRGIIIKPVEVASPRNESEPILKSIRDGIRAIIWLGTGYTGAKTITGGK
jgi:uncharacterized SAM-binding protein YcdF (DUF218 family)